MSGFAIPDFRDSIRRWMSRHLKEGPAESCWQVGRRWRGALRPPAQKHMGRALAGDVLDALITQRAQIDAVQKLFPGTEAVDRDGEALNAEFRHGRVRGWVQ